MYFVFPPLSLKEVEGRESLLGNSIVCIVVCTVCEWGWNVSPQNCRNKLWAPISISSDSDSDDNNEDPSLSLNSPQPESEKSLLIF